MAQATSAKVEGGHLSDQLVPGSGKGRWLLRLVGLVAAVAAVVWVWFTSRGEIAQFPTAFLQTEGLLLTALVFVLGFGQGSLRRAADFAVRDIEDWAGNIREAYDDSQIMSTLDLYQVALSVLTAFREARYLFNEVRREPRFWRNLYEDFSVRQWQDTSLNMAIFLGQIRQGLAGNAQSHKAPSTRRRRYLEKERRQIEAKRDNLFRDAKALGVRGGPRCRAIAGTFALTLSVASSLLRTLYAYIGVMLLLTAIGAVYAGWSVDDIPQPELWAALAFPALAISYSVIIRSDIDRETHRVVRSLETTWPARLMTAEFLLANVYKRDDRGSSDYLRIAEECLDSTEETTHTLGWFLSLKARVDFAYVMSAPRRLLMHTYTPYVYKGILLEHPGEGNAETRRSRECPHKKSMIIFASFLIMQPSFLVLGCGHVRPMCRSVGVGRLHRMDQRQDNRGT
jgi:hypothetical protein